MEDHLWLVFIAVGALALIQLGSIARGLQSTEAMLRRLLAHQGVEWDTPVEPSERVRELALGSGMRVEAIRAYRQQTGLGLKAAMEVVDQLSRQERGVPNPTCQRAAPPPLN